MAFKLIKRIILLGIIICISMNKNFAETKNSTENRRVPRHAGRWYEANPERLDKQLSEYLKNAEIDLAQYPLEGAFPGNKPCSNNIIAAVVPHAAYRYSGQIAAFAYEKLSNQKFNRIFLLGPSHYVAISGGALPTEKTFATPLGDLQIDRHIVNELCQFPNFKEMPEIHDREHSLELQLPLIRKTFGDVKIVPIAIGALADESDIRLLGGILKRYLQKGDLIIVSSDFTHFGPRYDYEPFTENIWHNLRLLDQGAFKCLSEPNLKDFIEYHEQTHDTICGFYPISVLLSMLPEDAHATLLRYRTSEEISPDPGNNSVSYMSIVFSTEDANFNWNSSDGLSNESNLLSEADGKMLLDLARAALTDHLLHSNQYGEVSQSMSPDQRNLFKLHRGAFVTLFSRRPDGTDEEKIEKIERIGKPNKTLRGCIGYIWPVKSLLDAVCENVISAAMRDNRFEPVEVGELKDLIIEISILTPPTTVKSWQEIRLGRDGIIMHKNGRQAVFLPSVATEFSWTLPETLTQLALKAGLGPDEWKVDTVFDVFQVQSFEEHG